MNNALHEYAGSFGTLAYRRTNSKAIFRISAFAAAVSAAMCFYGAIDETRADFETAFVSTWKVPSGQILRHECSALDSIAHTCATQGGKDERQSALSIRSSIAQDTHFVLFIFYLNLVEDDYVSNIQTSENAIETTYIAYIYTSHTLRIRSYLSTISDSTTAMLLSLINIPRSITRPRKISDKFNVIPQHSDAVE